MNEGKVPASGRYNRAVRDYPASDPASPTLVLAHGAGAGHDHPWIRRVAAGLAARGIRVVTFDFPYRAAGRKVPDPAPKLEDTFQAVWDEVALTARGPLFAGGKSMGGRIASQAAAKGALSPPAAGLIFFGYPLHPPGKPEQRRDRHLPSVASPMLFIQGTRDPFGTPDEMRALIVTLPRATLDLVEGGDHSLAVSKTRDRDGKTDDQILDRAAGWIGLAHGL